MRTVSSWHVFLHFTLAHAHGDVLRLTGGRVDAVDALIGGGRREGTELGNVGAKFDVVQTFGKHVGCGHPSAAGIPASAELTTVMPTDVTAEGKHRLGVVVAALDAHAGYGTEVRGHEGVEAFVRKFLADVVAEELAVAPRTAVGAKRKVHGKRHLVGVFLEYDVVVIVFKHGSSFEKAKKKAG